MRKANITQAFVGLFLAQCVLAWPLWAQDIDTRVAHSLEFARQQLANAVAEIGDSTRFPHDTHEDGSWRTETSSSWTSGFFPGGLWHLYEQTGANRWKKWAESWTAAMEKEKNDSTSHDVGFKIFTSFGNGYRLTKNQKYRDLMMQAAKSLATRFNPTVGCIRSWNNRTFPVIIDNMMSLEILFWAAKNGGDSTWHEMAVSHAVKTMENHVRADGSTYHIVDFNPATGEAIRKETRQGYADTSTWARGQAWGLYGFAMTYRETRDQRFLETAQKLADYFISHLPADHVPYWDFAAPNIPNEEKDASAAAIAASGLLELSQLATASEAQAKYRNAALNILASLSSPAYLAEGTNSSGILLHAVGNRPSGSEVDVSLIYADYYFIEALLRYLKLKTSVAAHENQQRFVPASIQLFQNYPNPFWSEATSPAFGGGNPATTISYHLPDFTNVSLNVYDLTGRLVRKLREGFQERGEHKVIFNGEGLSSGTYVILLQAGEVRKTRMMTLIR